MKKIIIILVLIILAGGVFYLFFYKPPVSENKVVSIDKHEFKVEIANDIQERAKGLGEREVLCDSCGMLFEFPEKGKYSFWMRGMKFPLDIIWISDDKIVYIAKNISSSFKGSINSNIEANRVLEINAGMVDEYGIEEGDAIHY